MALMWAVHLACQKVDYWVDLTAASLDESWAALSEALKAVLMVSSKAVLSAVQMEYLKEGLSAARKVDLTEPQKAVQTALPSVDYLVEH